MAPDLISLSDAILERLSRLRSTCARLPSPEILQWPMELDFPLPTVRRFHSGYCDYISAEAPPQFP